MLKHDHFLIQYTPWKPGWGNVHSGSPFLWHAYKNDQGGDFLPTLSHFASFMAQKAFEWHFGTKYTKLYMSGLTMIGLKHFWQSWSHAGFMAKTKRQSWKRLSSEVFLFLAVFTVFNKGEIHILNALVDVTMRQSSLGIFPWPQKKKKKLWKQLNR